MQNFIEEANAHIFIGICWQSSMFTGGSKAETLRTSNEQASKEELKKLSRQLVMMFILQLLGPRKCLERKKAGKKWVPSNIAQSNPGPLIKSFLMDEMKSVAGDGLEDICSVKHKQRTPFVSEQKRS